jgi:hypothetical protein
VYIVEVIVKLRITGDLGDKLTEDDVEEIVDRVIEDGGRVNKLTARASIQEIISVN